MSNKIPNSILQAIHTKRWGITPEYLDVIIGVASRELKDIEAVLSSPAVKKGSGLLSTRSGVGIINIGGVIAPYMNIMTEISGGTTIEQLGLNFGEALRSKEIKAIVLNIDSPGGDICGIHEFSNMVYEARGQKPIVAYVGNLCASAAYWIASACDCIIADKTATLGSIGVVASWIDDSAWMEKEGIKEYKLVSSQTPNKQQDLNSDEGLNSLQAELDGLANIFIESVATHRERAAKYVESNFGKGGVLLAEQAIKVGMADELGSLESVIQGLQEGKSFIKKGVIDMAKEEKLVLEDEEKDEEKESKTKAEDEEEEKDKETNKKAESEEDDEKDKEGKKASTLETKMSGLLLSDAVLFNAIKELGVKEERERMFAINEIAKVYGDNELVKKAMFNEPKSAKDLSFELIKAERVALEAYTKDYQEDISMIAEIKRSEGVLQTGEAKLKAEVEDVKKGYNRN